MNRGKRRKTQGEDPLPIEEVNEVSRSTAKRAWARLIKQVYEVDPLVCPRCTGPMRIIAFIEEPEVIEKILAHLGLCSALSQSTGPTRVHSPPVESVAAYAAHHSPARAAPGLGPPTASQSVGSPGPVVRLSSSLFPLDTARWCGGYAAPPGGPPRRQQHDWRGSGGRTGQRGRDRRAGPQKQIPIIS